MPRNHDEAPEWGDDDYVDLHAVIEQLTLDDYLGEEPEEIVNEEQ